MVPADLLLEELGRELPPGADRQESVFNRERPAESHLEDKNRTPDGWTWT